MSETTPIKSTSLSQQFGGSHYKGMGIEPAQYAHANGLGFLEGSAVKYLSRHQSKGKSEDVKKAIHFAVMILEMTYGVKTEFEFKEGPTSDV